MKMYALAIKGRMFYFLGEIAEDKYSAVDKIANSIVHDDTDTSFEKYLHDFTEKVFKELNITLVQIKVDYVFRNRG